MSRPAHKWQAAKGRTRVAVALGSTAVIGLSAVGVSSAVTPDQGGSASGRAPAVDTGARHSYALGAQHSKRSSQQLTRLRNAAGAHFQRIAPTVSAHARRHAPLSAQTTMSTASVRSAAVPTTADPTKAAPNALTNASPVGVPDSVDLSPFAPAPGDQRSVNSCVAWSLAYTAYGVVANEMGISGPPFAPMYTYAQVVQGQNIGTTPGANLDIATSQGIDTAADYTQGDYDFTTQPTAAETRNAANWKLTGYVPLKTGDQLESDVKTALSQNEPVMITIPVYQDFESMTQELAASGTYYPSPSSPLAGSHEVTVIGYNSTGVRVENSWGAGWGDSGFVTLSWKYLADQVVEANAIGALQRVG